VLADGVDLAFALIGDVLQNATFPDDEVELTRRRILSALEVERSQPAAIADRYFVRTLYGDHPYGTRETPASVRAITAGDIRQFAATYLRPEGLLVVAGDLGMDALRRLADTHLGAWRGVLPDVWAAPLPRATEILLVHRPGSGSRTSSSGTSASGRAPPDHYAATVANRVLGAGATRGIPHPPRAEGLDVAPASTSAAASISGRSRRPESPRR
jgi:zinc protease